MSSFIHFLNLKALQDYWNNHPPVPRAPFTGDHAASLVALRGKDGASGTDGQATSVPSA